MNRAVLSIVSAMIFTLSLLLLYAFPQQNPSLRLICAIVGGAALGALLWLRRDKHEQAEVFGNLVKPLSTLTPVSIIFSLSTLIRTERRIHLEGMDEILASA